ncbi:YqiA/YcfP family alpha/beta fold hydrolase [uncultured Dokdonia sp.]|uniref:YqiA/YcfP family alpha/beta fold hydrolase n=1 Tax=uncultured Dokdonia sp. TaxID=575653 RepID=UPI0026099153|nr:YqiA/YcfP family alpha/beta fold hydrolase [uncultured Dokdonia sp.]
MRILYLHGLMSKPTSVKVEWLKDIGHKVTSPLLDYKKESDKIYQMLQELCIKSDFDLIIGSSMGGFLAWSLSNQYDIPSLLFNPSLAANKIKKPSVISFVNHSILHTVIFGRDDIVVIPSETLEHLKDAKSNFEYTYESNGHRTPFSTFSKHFNALEKNNDREFELYIRSVDFNG